MTRFLRLFGLSTKRTTKFLRKILKLCLKLVHNLGFLIQAEKDLFDNVWRLDEKVGSLMTPRSDIVFIDVMAPSG